MFLYSLVNTKCLTVGNEKLTMKTDNFMMTGQTSTVLFSNRVTSFVCCANQTVAVAKISNMKRHYESKHKDFQSVVGEERTVKIQSLCRSLNCGAHQSLD